MPWTKERLQEMGRTCFGRTKLIVVANREPFVHKRVGDRIECQRPAGGLTAALAPVMEACGGTWVAHGSGDADREVCDERSRVAVPPEQPSFFLRRVWLTPEEEKGYYLGFANETMWPLCHIVHQRPTFNPEHWQHYVSVNQKFADAILDEVTDEPCVVFVQDYHLALLPRLLRQANPNLVIVHFWHIPWPNAEAFRVCPWQSEILEGLLGSDLISFHAPDHCRNFLDTVGDVLEAKVHREQQMITQNRRDTHIRPQPISIDPNLAEPGPDDARIQAELRQKLGVGSLPIFVGVDRIDYTKGIPERLRAVERFLERHPDWLGKFHFVQVGAPSRTDIDAYQRLNDEVQALTRTINEKYGTADWKPIVLECAQYSFAEINALYRTAVGCVVSSLHDGMNLVAKEFVAARKDRRGVLILSRFTGAAWEFKDALLVNPFHIDEIVDAMHRALTMSPGEQEARMVRLRRQVRDFNVYRWAGQLLNEGVKLANRRQWDRPARPKQATRPLQETSR